MAAAALLALLALRLRGAAHAYSIELDEPADPLPSTDEDSEASPRLDHEPGPPRSPPWSPPPDRFVVVRNQNKAEDRQPAEDVAYTADDGPGDWSLKPVQYVMVTSDRERKSSKSYRNTLNVSSKTTKVTTMQHKRLKIQNFYPMQLRRGRAAGYR